MSREIKNGGSAFAFAYEDELNRHVSHGMTLRDYFAGQAINGFVSTNNWLNDSDPLNIAKRAYCIADAMLKARGDL